MCGISASVFRLSSVTLCHYINSHCSMGLQMYLKYLYISCLVLVIWSYLLFVEICFNVTKAAFLCAAQNILLLEYVYGNTKKKKTLILQKHPSFAILYMFKQFSAMPVLTVPIFGCSNMLLNCSKCCGNLFHPSAISRLWTFSDTSPGLIFQVSERTKQWAPNSLNEMGLALTEAEI